MVRHERKKYKDKLKEKDLFIVEINNSASKKSLLCLYAEVYGEHYMYSNEISTRLELLNNYVLPETGMWTLEEQLIEIYEANYELGNYYEAELVLNQALLKVPHTVFGERVLYLKEELLEDGFIK